MTSSLLCTLRRATSSSLRFPLYAIRCICERILWILSFEFSHISFDQIQRTTRNSSSINNNHLYNIVNYFITNQLHSLDCAKRWLQMRIKQKSRRECNTKSVHNNKNKNSWCEKIRDTSGGRLFVLWNTHFDIKIFFSPLTQTKELYFFFWWSRKIYTTFFWNFKIKNTEMIFHLINWLTHPFDIFIHFSSNDISCLLRIFYFDENETIEILLNEIIKMINSF